MSLVFCSPATIITFTTLVIKSTPMMSLPKENILHVYNNFKITYTATNLIAISTFTPFTHFPNFVFTQPLVFFHCTYILGVGNQ